MLLYDEYVKTLKFDTKNLLRWIQPSAIHCPLRSKTYLCTMDQSFGKEYKLCSKKIIGRLFESGKRLSSFPFTLTYSFETLPIQTVPFQVVISVPKRIFKRAHDRNRIKRLMRECLRKNKHILEDFLSSESNKRGQMALFLVYRFNEEPDYEALMRKMSKLLLTLTTSIEKNEK